MGKLREKRKDKGHGMFKEDEEVWGEERKGEETRKN